jgi:hypothetical protein
VGAGLVQDVHCGWSSSSAVGSGATGVGYGRRTRERNKNGGFEAGRDARLMPIVASW